MFLLYFKDTKKPLGDASEVKLNCFKASYSHVQKHGYY